MNGSGLQSLFLPFFEKYTWKNGGAFPNARFPDIACDEKAGSAHNSPGQKGTEKTVTTECSVHFLSRVSPV